MCHGGSKKNEKGESVMSSPARNRVEKERTDSMLDTSTVCIKTCKRFSERAKHPNTKVWQKEETCSLPDSLIMV